MFCNCTIVIGWEGIQCVNEFGNLLPLISCMTISPHMNGALIGLCVLNILIPYAALEPELCQDISASNQCHPLLLQVLKPIVTSGDDNCMFNALSPTIAGTEHLSAVLRLLCVYGLVKYKETMIRAITHAWGSSRAQGMYARDLHIAVTNGARGTDNHLFVMSLMLYRPIFLFNTFYFTDSDTNQVTLYLMPLTSALLFSVSVSGN